MDGLQKALEKKIEKELTGTPTISGGDDEDALIDKFVTVERAVPPHYGPEDRTAFILQSIAVDLRSQLNHHQCRSPESILEALLRIRGVLPHDMERRIHDTRRRPGENALMFANRFAANASLSTLSVLAVRKIFIRSVSDERPFTAYELSEAVRLDALESNTNPEDFSLSAIASVAERLETAANRNAVRSMLLDSVADIRAAVLDTLPKGTPCAHCHGNHASKDCSERKKRPSDHCPTCLLDHIRRDNCPMLAPNNAAREQSLAKNGVIYSGKQQHVVEYGATLVEPGTRPRDLLNNLNKRRKAASRSTDTDARSLTYLDENDEDDYLINLIDEQVRKATQSLFGSRAPNKGLDGQCTNPTQRAHPRPAGSRLNMATVDVVVDGQRDFSMLRPTTGHREEQPFILEETSSIGLADSGASRSCTGLNHLTTDQRMRMVPASGSAKGFDGSPVALVGKVDLRVKVGTRATTLCALVFQHMDIPLILGLDAITKLGIVIDGESRTIRCGEDIWPLPIPEEPAWNDRIAALYEHEPNVTACFDLHLPPRSQAVVVASAGEWLLPAGATVPAVVEPLTGQKAWIPADVPAFWTPEHNTPHYVLAGRTSGEAKATYTNASRKAPSLIVMVPVFNPSDDVVVVRKGTTLGTLTEAPGEPVTIGRITVPDDDIPRSDRGWTDKDDDAMEKALDVSPPSFDEWSEAGLRAAIDEAVARAAVGLDEKQLAQIKEVLLDEILPMRFDPSSSAVSEARTRPVVIHLELNAVPAVAGRRQTSAQGEQFKEETEAGFLRMGIVEPCEFSEWASAVHLAKKKDGSFRYCIDMRGLNRWVRKFSYPLPTCQELIDALAGATWFSTIDCKSGYWQFPLDPASRHLTAFRSVRHGLLQWRRLPMGLATSSAEYQKRMEQILRGLTWQQCLCYQDDIIIYSKTWDEHIVHLRQVLARLREANITINLRKCYFGQREVSYLGFRVDGHGVYPDARLIEKINAFKGPLDFEQTRMFLGQTVLYRKFAYAYADICKPLRDAVTKASNHAQKEIKGAFIWTPQCDEALKELQRVMSQPPLLRHPDPERPYFLFTDASNYAIGCVLCQRDDDGTLHPVLFDSVALPPRTRAWNTTEKEAYAVVHYVHKLSHYVDNGKDLTIYTDHSAVNRAISSPGQNGKLLRWGLSLSPYVGRLIIQHWPGKQMPADFWSRHPMHLSDPTATPPGPGLRLAWEPVSDCDNAIALLFAELVEEDHSIASLDNMDWVTQAVAQLQDECEEIGPLAHFLRDQTRTPTPAAKRLLLSGPFKRDAEGRVWRSLPGSNDELVVPAGLRTFILGALHDAPTGGHLKHNKLLDKLKGRYWWPSRDKDAADWHDSCESCQRHRVPRHAPFGHFSSLRALEPFSVTAMDLIGPLPTTSGGNKYILVWTDYFTRWTEAVAIPNKKAKTVARAYWNEIVCRWGPPLRLLTDCGKEFINSTFKAMATLGGFGHITTSPYHPQADGMTERFNGTLIRMLAHHVLHKQNDWDEIIPSSLFAYRTASHATTGVSPYRAMVGLEARQPVDAALLQRNTLGTINDLVRLREEARAEVLAGDEKRIKSTERANEARRPNPFAAGHLVMVKVQAINKEREPGAKKGAATGRSLKLAHRYSMPMRVTSMEGNMLELAPVANPRLTVRASSENCEFFVLPRGLSRLSRDEEDNYLNQRIPDAHNHGFVTAIAGHKDVDGKRFYSTVWEALKDIDQRTWEPADNFDGDKSLIVEYERGLARLEAAGQPVHAAPVADNPDPLSALARRGQQAGSQPASPSRPRSPPQPEKESPAPQTRPARAPPVQLNGAEAEDAVAGKTQAEPPRAKGKRDPLKPAGEGKMFDGPSERKRSVRMRKDDQW
jgi:hypothetical protein